ncbi:MAG: UvrD-helicase domain-containing protein [Verrucomicrobiales bacterium]
MKIVNPGRRPSHVTIFASAGTGKTYELTARYIRLLASQLPGNPLDDATALRPGSLLALTFTRKAAAEFFHTILGRLAAGAASSEGATKLAAELNTPWLERQHFVRLLRAMIQDMPRLALGTLDSFFARLLRAFPFEFGLGGPFTLTDEAMAAGQRLRVYRRLFRPEVETSTDESGFLRAFRLATIGREERNITDRLEGFIGRCHGLCLEVWEEAKWGSAVAGWKPFGEIVLGRNGRAALSEACERLDQAIERERCSEVQREAWREIALLIRHREPGTPLDGRLNRFFTKKIGRNWEELGIGNVEFPMGRRKSVWSPMLCQSVRAAMTVLIGLELQTQAAQTKGLWQIARQFEAHYDSLIRRHGRLTFADLAYLLAGATATARATGVEAWRLKREALESRLDARYDHWLVDEFQDTSLLQWRIIEPLVSELLQCDDGTRTYFHVGDIKQAIYGWRGGEARLARLLLQEINHSQQRIKECALTKSRRSCPPIIDMINAVFGASEVMQSLFPPMAVERWEWKAHSSANPNTTGCAVVIRPNQAPGEDAADSEWRAVAALLKEVDPVSRGLTCAVLLRRNEDVLDLGNFLRQESLHVAADAESPVATDNPFTLALLSLLQFAAHPGDTFAREHVRFTPLQQIISENGWSDGALVWQVLRAVEEHGIEGTLRIWIDRLGAQASLRPAGTSQVEACSGIDPFSRRRGEELLQIAREFDFTGSRDLDAFLEAARSIKRREPPDLASVVQVMTIHQSKGLGFDIVIVPRLGWPARGRAGRGLGISRKRPPPRTWRDLYETEWLLRSPAQAISTFVAPLSACLEEARAAEHYGNFCLFYVAMTRAKRGLYVISGELNAGAEPTPDPHGWLETVVALQDAKGCGPVVSGGQIFQVGAPFGTWEWFKECPKKPAALDREVSLPAPAQRPKSRLQRRRPSGESAARLRAAQLFAPAAASSRAFGTLVHTLFQQVADPEDLSALEQWQRHHLPKAESWQIAALSEVRACLENPAIRAAMGRPAPGVSIWREQTFEIIIDQKWVTGTFDRVIVEKDCIRIVDFKTDFAVQKGGIEEKVNAYRPQLEVYRIVAARLTGASEEAISAALILTPTQQVVPVNFI